MSGLLRTDLSVTLRISLIWLMAILLFALGALAFLGWFAAALLVMMAFAIAFAARYLRDSDEPTRHSVEAAAALLSSLALIAAGYWYFVERPRVPKIAIEPQIQAWSAGEGMALVRVSLGLENVGSTAVILGDDDPIELEIGQVLPANGRQYRALAAELGRAAGGPRKAARAIRTDQWPLRASLHERTDIVVEAGETEKLHYKAIVRCEPGLLLAVTAKVPKRLHWFDRLFTESRHETLYWIGQSLTEDPIADCKGAQPDG